MVAFTSRFGRSRFSQIGFRRTATSLLSLIAAAGGSLLRTSGDGLYQTTALEPADEAGDPVGVLAEGALEGVLLGANVLDAGGTWNLDTGVTRVGSRLTFTGAEVTSFGNNFSGGNVASNETWFVAGEVRSLTQGSWDFRGGAASTEDLTGIATVGPFEGILTISATSGDVDLQVFGRGTTIGEIEITEFRPVLSLVGTAPSLDARPVTTADGELDYDGVDDRLVLRNLPEVENLTLDLTIESDDDDFMLISNGDTSADNYAFLPKINNFTSNTESGTAVENMRYFISGQEIFNPSRDDLYSLTYQQRRNIQLRGIDTVADNSWQTITLGAWANGTFLFEGTMKDITPYADATDAQLDAITARLHIEEGLVNEGAKTVADVITAAGGGGAWDTANARVNGKWRAHNLLTHSEDFSNAVWSKVNVTATTDTFEAASTSTFRYLYQNISMSPGQQWTLEVEAKEGTTEFLFLLGQTSSDCFGVFDLSGGTYEGKGSFAIAADSGEITSLGDGWYRCKIVFTKTNAAAPEQIGYGVSDSGGSTATAGANVSVRYAHLYRSDFGGMADNPDTGDSYVPTTNARVYPSQPLLMWADKNGVTPAVNDGDAVGLLLSYSGGLTQDPVTYELGGLGDERVTNGTLDTNVDDWLTNGGAIATWNAGALNVDRNGGGGGARVYQSIPSTDGELIYLSLDSDGAGDVRAGPGLPDSSSMLNHNILAGSNSYIAVAPPTSFNLSLRDTSGTINVDNISARKIPAVALKQPVLANRPTLDAATGLLQGGVDKCLELDLTGYADRTNMTIGFLYKGTDTKFILGGTASTYLLSCEEASANENVTLGAGSPRICVNSQTKDYTNRGDVYTDVSDGELKLIEIIGADLSDSAWDTLLIGDFPVLGWSVDDLYAPAYILPNNDLTAAERVFARNNIRRDILTQHPDLNFG